jgi:hypothetical protein
MIAGAGGGDFDDIAALEIGDESVEATAGFEGGRGEIGFQF